MERVVREIGIVSCAEELLIEARTSPIAHPKSSLDPRQITRSPYPPRLLADHSNVQQNHALPSPTALPVFYFFGWSAIRSTTFPRSTTRSSHFASRNSVTHF